MQCIFYGTLLDIHVYAATCIRPIFRNILHNSFKDFHWKSYAAVWFFFLFYFVCGFSFTPATNGAFKIEQKDLKKDQPKKLWIQKLSRWHRWSTRLSTAAKNTRNRRRWVYYRVNYVFQMEYILCRKKPILPIHILIFRWGNKVHNLPHYKWFELKTTPLSIELCAHQNRINHQQFHGNFVYLYVLGSVGLETTLFHQIEMSMQCNATQNKTLIIVLSALTWKIFQLQSQLA